MQKIKGRPKGSEIDDSNALDAIADMLVANPGLKPTTALRRHNRKVRDAEKRRIQGKWKNRKDLLLAAAQSRLEIKRQLGVGIGVPRAPSKLGATAEAARMMQEIYNPPTMRAMRAIYEAQNSPGLRLMREVYDSPSMRLAREVYDSPSMRLAREISESRSKLNRMLGGW